MQKAKRYLSALIAAGLVVTAAGCSNSASNGSFKDEPVTLTVLITQSRNYDGLKNMMEKTEKEENIKFDCQVVPDDQYENIVKMRLNSGEAPDLIDMNFPAGLSKYDVEEYCLDLSDQEWAEKLISPQNVTLNGKIYGFPFKQLQGLQGFIYNKDLFDELGLEEPETWDEFLNVCETIKNESDAAPIGFPNEGWVPQILIVDNMTKALGRDGTLEFCEKVLKNEAKWNEVPEFAECIDEYLNLFEKGYVNEDYLSATYDDTLAAIGEGRMAMCFNANMTATSIQESYPDTEIGMFVVNMPVAAESDFVTVNNNTPGMLVNKDSKNMDTVLKVLELWSTPEYADLYFESAPGFPAFPDVNGGELPDYLQKLAEKYVDTDKTFETINTYIGSAESCTSSYLWLYYIDAPSKGMDGQEILDKFQQDYEKYMQESKQPGF